MTKTFSENKIINKLRNKAIKIQNCRLNLALNLVKQWSNSNGLLEKR